MNITEKVMFNQEVQIIPNDNLNFNEMILLFVICYAFTRLLHHFCSPYVNL